ncbi:MAG: GDSL-type esterase/lipase family protein, partial [Bryobacteraceae bacterium]
MIPLRASAATALAALAAASLAPAQSSAVLTGPQALALFKRSVQLVESTAASVPGLARASAPVLENARQAAAGLETGRPDHAGQTYNLLTHLRGYLALADSVPKPHPFPEEARRQFSELRDAVDRLEAHLRTLLDQKETQLRSPDRDNLRRYSEENERLDKPSGSQPRIVFLGDSITNGWRLNEYFPGREFVNRGIGGQITGEMLGRMKADVINLKPAAVVILAGTNDLARGVPVTTVQNNLTMIADLANFHGVKVVLASVLPVSDYHKGTNPRFEQTKVRSPVLILQLNTWIAAFCKQRNFTHVDYFSAMVDPSGFLKANLADDGLHPNGAGYRVMSPLVIDGIEGAVAAPKATPMRKKRFGVF